MQECRGIWGAAWISGCCHFLAPSKRCFFKTWCAGFAIIEFWCRRNGAEHRAVSQPHTLQGTEGMMPSSSCPDPPAALQAVSLHSSGKYTQQQLLSLISNSSPSVSTAFTQGTGACCSPGFSCYFLIPFFSAPFNESVPGWKKCICLKLIFNAEQTALPLSLTILFIFC